MLKDVLLLFKYHLRYFPNIKDNEIEKHYTVPELLQLSRFR